MIIQFDRSGAKVFLLVSLIDFEVQTAHIIGLNRTGHMGFLTGQDRTPKFAGQVLPDRTESRTYIFNILPNKYGLSILIW